MGALLRHLPGTGSLPASPRGEREDEFQDAEPMKLADLRKLSIKKQVRIRFRFRNGMECVINEHGIAQVPALNSDSGFQPGRGTRCAQASSCWNAALAVDRKKACPGAQASDPRRN